MPSLTAARLAQITDLIAGAYAALLGTSGSGFGAGDGSFGWSAGLTATLAAISGTGDFPLMLKIGQPLNTAAGKSAAAFIAGATLHNWYLAMNSQATSEGFTGVSDLKSLASYYNTGAGGPWSALLSPVFDDVYAAVATPTSGTASLGPLNLYAPVITNMGSRTVGGSFAAGTAVDASSFAGAAAARLHFTGGAWSGADAVTVTGIARTGLGATVTGATFTTGDIEVFGTGSVLLSPTVAGEILLSVTDITLPAAMTAGTATVSCDIPTR